MRRFQFRRRVPGGKMVRILWWDFIRFLTAGLLRVLYRLRVTGVEHVPSSGPILFVSNHQSYFDPAINAMVATDRQFTAIAREKLFRFKPFGLLIRSIGALSVAGEGGDAAALKIALSELNAGRCILIYPEGTRSPDGTMQPFQRGVLLLQRRAKVDVVPVGLDGASDIWPRDRAKPLWRGRLAACAGPVIPASRLASLSTDEAMDLLESEVDRLRLQARALIRERTGGRWPLPGPADQPRVRAKSAGSAGASAANGDNATAATDGEAR